MARQLKFRIKEVEELYNLIRKNKSADQLHDYFPQDVRFPLQISDIVQSDVSLYSYRMSFYGCR